MSKLVGFEERITIIPRERVIDDGENWILRDVVLLSEHSKNVGPNGKPRRYTPQAQEKACPTFEGLQVNMNHPQKGPDGKPVSRDVLNILGKVTNPRLREVNEGNLKVTQTIGDILMVKGERANHVVNLARLDPKLAGMSITGNGDFSVGERSDDIVTLQPGTVDVVDRPATTKGLFEAAEAEGISISTLTEALGLAEKVDAFLKGKGKKPEDEEDGSDEDGTETSDDDGKVWGKAGKGDYGAAPDQDDDEDGEKDAKVWGKGKPKKGTTDDVGQAKGNKVWGSTKDASQQMNAVQAVTDKANSATTRARSSRSSQSHMDAAYAHAGAASQCAELGDQRQARLHMEKSREHEGYANKLTDAEQRFVRKPSPHEDPSSPVAPPTQDRGAQTGHHESVDKVWGLGESNPKKKNK